MMDEWPPFVPYLILAFICGLASFGIVAVAMFCVFSHGGYMSDLGMFAVAGMAFAPAALGTGIATCMSRDRR